MVADEVIEYCSRRYVVEVGETTFIGHAVSNTQWRFLRAFDTREDASAHGQRVAEDYEHVRVVDRGESK